MERDVTIIIPHIPVRPNALAKAVKSAAVQTIRPTDIIIATDIKREGAATTRNRALDRATTTWVAFLDDDDVLYPNHLEVLLDHAEETDADVVYSGCDVVNPLLGGQIPVKEEWGRFGKPFDGNLMRKKSYIPVTSLVRTDEAQKARFAPPPGSHYEDWGFYLRLLDMGAVFSHVAEITWLWNHGDKNTSGQPDRW
jgi:glycosyltransferase involved in cell wall biosynthesis